MAKSHSIAVGLRMRAVAFPAPDMPGEWLTHSLDLDIIAQGASAQAAFESLEKSILEMIAFRLSRGLHPVEWNSAPDDIWILAEKAAGGAALDRRPPSIEFATSAENLPEQAVSLVVADRAPSPIAHAG
jgi:hypothetical protein